MFLAGPLPPAPDKMTEEAGGLLFLQSSKRLAAATRCKVIDLRETLAGESGGVLRIPSLERHDAAKAQRDVSIPSGFSISAHPATIVISTIVLRLVARFPVASVVAHVFGPASEIGSHGH